MLAGEDKIKEQIKFQIELLRIAAVVMIAIGGGVVELIRNGIGKGSEIFFTSLGLMLFVGTIVVGFKCIKTVRMLTK
jgi:hypothetical protein